MERDPRKRPLLSTTVGLLAICFVGMARSIEASTASILLDEKLASETSVHWENVPLAHALKRIGEAHRLSIFLDRRVDPGERISLSMRDVSVTKMLKAIGEQIGCDISRLGGICYFGPENTARELRTTAYRNRLAIKQLLRKAGQQGNTVFSMQWARLSEPRSLCEQLITHAGFTATNLEKIPHDLWSTGNYPNLSLSDSLTLLLIGFDLSFEVKSNAQQSPSATINICQWEPARRVSKRYRWPIGDTTLDELSAMLPLAKIKLVNKRLSVQGRVEDHELVSSLISPTKTKRRVKLPGKQVFSLRVQEQPAQAILDALARQIELTIEIAPSDKPSISALLKQRVSFSVQKVDLEELLEAVLHPVDLTPHLREKHLIIKQRIKNTD